MPDSPNSPAVSALAWPPAVGEAVRSHVHCDRPDLATLLDALIGSAYAVVIALALCANPRVVIADDQPLVRAGLAMLLDAEPDIEVVAEADEGAGAVARAGELHPDVVLMDVRMPGIGGIEATRRITALVPSTWSGRSPSSISGPKLAGRSLECASHR